MSCIYDSMHMQCSMRRCLVSIPLTLQDIYNLFIQRLGHMGVNIKTRKSMGFSLVSGKEGIQTISQSRLYIAMRPDGGDLKLERDCINILWNIR